MRLVAVVGLIAVAASTSTIAVSFKIGRKLPLPNPSGSVLVLPAPGGPFLVGTGRLEVEAPGRPVVVITWYPAADSTGRERAPYLREQSAIEVLAAQGRGPAVTALKHRQVATHSWLEAPLVRSGSPLPILIFSHGYLAMPSDYTALMEDLASHGFVVFSIAHSGETMAVSLANGRRIAVVNDDGHLAPAVQNVLGEWGIEDSVSAAVTSAADATLAATTLRRYLTQIPHSTAALDRWVEDTRVVVDQIAALAAPGSGSPFSGRIDLARLGALGHSMGGVTSIAFCARDSRCKAALNLDGSPQYGDLIDRPSPRPVLMVYGERPGRIGVSDLIYSAGVEYWRALVHGALHLNFGDWLFWDRADVPEKSLGSLAPARSVEITCQLVRQFFRQQLDGVGSALLAGERKYPELEVRRVTP